MDAAQTNIKKIALFLATALLLIAPFQASAQPTLGTTATSVALGSSSCNDYQNVTLSSSDSSNLGFTVYVQYQNGNTYGNWIYASVSGGRTSTSSAIAGSTGTTGTSLTIGLNSNSGIGTATPSATVVITPNNASPAVDITVFYSQNTSCGGSSGTASNGFITVTPGTIALTASTTGQQSQTVTIKDTTGTGMTFGYSVSASWLSVQLNSTTISGNGSTPLTLTATAAQTAGAGTYQGILTITPQSGFGSSLDIPVTFTVTNGTTTCTTNCSTTGTLTVNGATSNTDIETFTYIAPTTPGGKCISIQDTAAGANYYYSQVTTINGGNWLLANNQLSTTTTGLLAPGSNACVNLTLSSVASTLGSGAYQGSVALTSSSGSTATISVNLYVSAGAAPGITVTPGLIYIFPNVAANSSVAQQEVFSLTAASGYLLGTASLTSSIGGFSMSTPVASNNTESFTVYSNSNGLTTGVYSATVTMTSSYGSSTNTTTITIVLPVGQSGTTTTTGNSTSVIAPTALTFQQQANSSYWTGGQEAQAITITGAQGGQWSASIVYTNGSNWLNIDSPVSASGTFGTTPATLLVDLFSGVTNLNPSSTPYAATVNITTPSGTYYVSVNLLVTAVNVPVLLGQPASATISVSSTGSSASQTVTVVGSDNTQSTTSPVLTLGTPTASWLTATTSGNSMTVTANPSGQTTGVYAGTIPVSSGVYSNAINYPVVMIVNGGGGSTSGTGPLTLSSTTLTFSGITSQSSQNLGVTAASSTNFSVYGTETTCSGNWLQVANSSYTATSVSTPITVTVNPSGINNGTTCTGTVTLVTASATQTVTVSMSVGTSTGSGNVTVSPTAMSFAYTQNQTVPAAQTATIVNAVSNTASITFTVATAENNGTSTTWLTASTTSASTPYNSPGLSVSVVPGNLSPGTYTGTVTITPNGGTAQAINVTLTVTGSAVISATPTTLNLSYLVGSTVPTATIQVSGGGSSAGFTATATSSAGWLAVTPNSGTTPNTGTSNLTVSIVSSVLATLPASATPYTGTIAIAAVSPATGTTNVQVSLTVSAPLPEITGITNAASGATGAVSPGELISIFANPSNPIGPATSYSLTLTSAGLVSTKLGGVQVKFLPDGVFAPLTFVNEGQINAIVPYEVAGIASLQVEVLYLGQTSNAWPLTLTPTAPGIFTSNGSGTGQAALLQTDLSGNQTYNTPSTPAKVGWYLTVYMTGEGVVSPSAITGSVTQVSSTAPLTPVPVVAPTVLIGGQPATVAWYGEAPGLVSGVLQVDVIVPPGAGTGSVKMSVALGTAASQAGVTVSLQ